MNLRNVFRFFWQKKVNFSRWLLCHVCSKRYFDEFVWPKAEFDTWGFFIKHWVQQYQSSNNTFIVIIHTFKTWLFSLTFMSFFDLKIPFCIGKSTVEHVLTDVFGLMEASWNRLISPDSKTKLKIQKIPNSIIFWWLLSIRPLFQGCSWTVLHGKTDCNTRFNRHFWAHESYSKLPDFTKSKTEPSSSKILG